MGIGCQKSSERIAKTLMCFIVGMVLTMSMSLPLSAQVDVASRYERGKAFYLQGQYDFAMEEFKPILSATTGNYGPYASFYYAVSAYKAGYSGLAKNMFLQVQERYPTWQFIPECQYWTSVIYFEEGNYDGGLRYSGLINEATLKQQIHKAELHHLDQIDSFEHLQILFEKFPENEALAKVILRRVDQTPLEFKDFELAKEAERILSTSEPTLPSIHKSEYNVALLFPFIFENMEASGYFLRKSVIVDLFEGFRQGYEDAVAQGYPINLVTYDTKGDSAATRALVESGELLDADLIVGPLLPEPIKVVNQYSYDHKINVINPISTNDEIISRNPFAFLLNPSTKTIGQMAGQIVSSSLADRTTMIFYGNSLNDRQMATAFRDVVMADSMDVIIMSRVTADSAEAVFRMLTAKQPVYDSLGNKVMGEDDFPLEELIIPKDSVGSIFISTFDFKIASEIMSAVAERGDSIQVVGHGRWLLDKTANFPYLERLGVWLLAPNHFDYSHPHYRAFVEEYIEKHHELPNEFVATGYQGALFAAYCLKNYGVYFQNELYVNKLGQIGFGSGYDFSGGFNDNQLIPILRFEDLELREVNIVGGGGEQNSDSNN